ncbi:MAG TPA: hypothetical protein IAD37_01490 [Candidatus Limiplasma merdipullorum]|nr:hypothetical protein [Candidatus Limiplasma merdipullorum]
MELSSERAQLDRLRAAYKDHLAVEGNSRLKWLEREIDMQEEKVKVLTAARNATHPGGCLACASRATCSLLSVVD